MKLTMKSSEKAPANWVEHIRDCDGTVYQSPAWVDISSVQLGQPVYFEWCDDMDTTVAIAVAFKKESAFPLIGRWNGLFFLESTPVIHRSSNVRLDGLMDDLCAYAVKVGCKLLDFESHMGQELSPDGLTVGRRSVNSRIEFRLNLQKDEEQIWSEFSKHHRRKIGKARRAPLSIVSGQTQEMVQTLRELQRGSQTRRNDRGENMELGDDGPIVNFMERVLAADLGNLYLVEDDLGVISGALISIYNDKVYYVFGGSNERGFAQNAPGLLFWEMICRCRADGCTEFNFGGVPGDAREKTSHANGLYRFKSGFGGEELERFSGSIALRPGIIAIANFGASLRGKSK